MFGNWKSNLKKAISGNELKANVVAGVGAAVPYVLVPTLFNLNDWAGFATAIGSSWGLGALLGNTRWQAASIAIGVTHLIQAYFKEDIYNALGKNPWNFTAVRGGEVVETQDGLYDASYYQMPNGETVVGVPAAELPQAGVSDYYTGNDTLMDYYNGAAQQNAAFMAQPGANGFTL